MSVMTEYDKAKLKKLIPNKGERKSFRKDFYPAESDWETDAFGFKKKRRG